MKGQSQYNGRRSIGVAGLVMLLIVGAPMMASARNQNPRVLPPHAHAYGKSYAEWHGAWWDWAFGKTPVDQNPVTDETGEFCHIGQSGPVFFLAGSFGGTVERTCTVPAGKALFFPLLNFAFILFANDPPLDEDCVRNNYECLRGELRPFIDIGEVSCEIDGVPVRNLAAYRAESTVFEINATAGSFMELFGAPLGPNGPAVDDGYYLMLAPLRVGRHTIHLVGRIPDFFGPGDDFVTDVTYHLTVVPRNAR
jgi:hypothetical protein